MHRYVTHHLDAVVYNHPHRGMYCTGIPHVLGVKQPCTNTPCTSGCQEGISEGWYQLARWSGVMRHACMCTHTLIQPHIAPLAHRTTRCTDGQPATQPPNTHPDIPMKYTEIRVCSECLCGWVLRSAYPGVYPGGICEWYDMTWWVQQHTMRCVMQHAMCIHTHIG